MRSTGFGALRIGLTALCLWLAACGGKVMVGDDDPDASGSGGSGGTGGSGGYGGTGYAGTGYGGTGYGGYGGGGYGGTGYGGYGGGGYGGTGYGGYGGGGYGGTGYGGYGGGGYGGTGYGGYGGGGYGGTGYGGYGGGGYGGTGYGGYGGGGYGGSPECALTIGDQDCDYCFHSSCYWECVAFMEDPAAMDYLNCASSCADAACLYACEQQYPSGAMVMDALDSCLATNCAVECTYGAECGLMFSDPVCDSCFQASCHAECVEATNAPFLVECLDCYLACPDQACIDSCIAEYPEAGAALNKVFACVEVNCTYECGGG